MVDLYYAGIGSRDTPYETLQIMTESASLLESYGYILRSGGATGADTAFEIGVTDKCKLNIFLPYPGFNGHTVSDSHIYIDDDSEFYRDAYESLILHPRGFNMSLSTRNMMIRNYFQAHGINKILSSFIICWTPGAANGYSIPTSYNDGGTAQCIRIAAKNNIPVYNLKDPRYSSLSAQELVDLILDNIKSNINPDIIKRTTTNLF